MAQISPHIHGCVSQYDVRLLTYCMSTGHSIVCCGPFACTVIDSSMRMPRCGNALASIPSVWLVSAKDDTCL